MNLIPDDVTGPDSIELPTTRSFSLVATPAGDVALSRPNQNVAVLEPLVRLAPEWKDAIR
jgi:hypothetical protein